MALTDQLLSHRKDKRLLLVVLGLLLIPLTGFYYFLQTARDIPATLVTNRVLLFILWYVNVVLILAVVFVLARNLFKLLLERRHRMLGAKFKSKLVATYIGLSLVPVLVLFLYATGFLQLSMDRWFSAPVKEVLETGAEVGNELLRMTEGTTQRDARIVAAALAGFPLADPAQRPELGDRLYLEMQRLDLDVLVVYQGRDFLQGVLNPRGGFADLPEPDRSLILQAEEEGAAVRITAPVGAADRIVFAAAPVSASEPLSILVAGRRLPDTGRSLFARFDARGVDLRRPHPGRDPETRAQAEPLL